MTNNKVRRITARKKADGKKGLKIGEVARSAGVSTATVHYYMKEGLLTPPVLTSRNMSYYAPRCVEEIRIIKELQSKKYLPLSVIKLMMESGRHGQGAEHLTEMRTLIQELFKPGGHGDISGNLSFDKLVTKSGLTAAILKQLEKSGLLMPTGKGRGRRYDDIDLRIALTARELIRQGMIPDDLGIISEYSQVIYNLAYKMHDIIHKLHDKDGFSLKSIFTAFESLKTLLWVKANRRVFLELHK